MLTPIEAILECGDFLEREIFRDSMFADQFNAYPIIWSALVLPNRNPDLPTLALAGWQSFGEHHYSAIVRCWNARRSAQRIMEASEYLIESPDDYERYLDLQEYYVSFFCSIGGAKDNLQAVSKLIDAEVQFQARCGSSTKYGSLQWFYERRTQAVHKIIVPFFDVEGVPHFDMSAFVDPDCKWDSLTNIDIRCVADVVLQLWSKFVYEINGAWSVLLTQLKHRYRAEFERPIDESKVVSLGSTVPSGCVHYLKVREILSSLHKE
jgi:hypothetical protein